MQRRRYAPSVLFVPPPPFLLSKSRGLPLSFLVLFPATRSLSLMLAGIEIFFAIEPNRLPHVLTGPPSRSALLLLRSQSTDFLTHALLHPLSLTLPSQESAANRCSCDMDLVHLFLSRQNILGRWEDVNLSLLCSRSPLKRD